MNTNFRYLFWFVCFCSNVAAAQAQIIINEGSNKNYALIKDEEQEAPDWIELYNAGSLAVDLAGYSLTDEVTLPAKWVFPSYIIEPGAYLIVFCSDKNRVPTIPFTQVGLYEGFTPDTGWNVHTFSTPFAWNGTDNLIVNTCSYSDQGYTLNSSFRQQTTDYISTLCNVLDGTPAACTALTGWNYYNRPAMQINGITVGEGTYSNSYTDYPAPYGNWYWSARHQIMLRADELTAAGIMPGDLTSLAFDVDSTTHETYSYVEFSLGGVPATEMSNIFFFLEGSKFHTNFKIADAGETIYLFDAAQNYASSLLVQSEQFEQSRGSITDGSATQVSFDRPTPGATNNGSNNGTTTLTAPTLLPASGVFTGATTVEITHTNSANAAIYYTLDGTEPTPTNGLLYTQPLDLTENTVIKAQVFEPGFLASPKTFGSYLIGLVHTTPIISVITTPESVYGSWGIFDNPFTDWKRAGYVSYHTKESGHPLLFEQKIGYRMDGGAGGSRGNPQRSFRLEFNEDDFGANKVIQPGLFDRRPLREKFSRLYLRNGSNQWMNLPHKDAMQVFMMSDSTFNYYSAMRPVSVYMNGAYLGLYEQREKFDAEYFVTLEGANPEKIDLLTQSVYYGGEFRALEGSVDSFWADYNAFSQLNTNSPNYWDAADVHFDLQYNTDYIAAETWMGNVDWPQNNIKIYRSDKTNYRWRFCLIDLELSMGPDGWTDCNTNMIDYITNSDPNNAFIHIWQQNMQNEKYYTYFINRYADLMNSAYKSDRLTQIANSYYTQMVPEWINETQRWGDPNANPQDVLDQFASKQAAFVADLQCRSEQVRNHIQAQYNLPQQTLVILDVIPADAGTIQISTLEPNNYPWEGIYFDGVDIKVEAQAKFGYTFSHWQPNSAITDTLSPLFLDQLGSNELVFTAVFKPEAVSVFNFSTTEWNIYPTLAQDFITLAHGTLNTQHATFSITDMAGRVVQTGSLNTTDTESIVALNSLPVGHYTVSLVSENHVFRPAGFMVGR
jgi:CotH kinase protein/Chitobiase/beta-hexosaminidase C-terminal domain/Lamin Tail Domain